MRARVLRTAAALALGALLAAPAHAEDTWTSSVVAAGTRFETPVHVHDTGEPGPVVVIVAGLHGDEPASAIAADQIRHWPLLRGRLVVVPRANLPALVAGKRLTPDEADTSLRNANRNFPRAAEAADAPARGDIASGLWDLLQREGPDWVLDLHEGTDVHARNRKSVGRSVICARDATSDPVVAAMVAAGSATVGDPTLPFSRLTQPVDGSLARAAAEHTPARAMIVETAKKGFAVSTRVWRHRTLVRAFLVETGMLAPDVAASDVGYRQGVRAGTVVGIYDGGGTGGKGVPYLLRQAAAYPDTAAARVGPTEIQRGALAAFDVVVFPGGMGGTQSKYLGAAGRRNVRTFVEGGGGYVGICAGAYLACSGFSWGLGILDARTASPLWKRGSGTVRMQATDSGRATLDAAESAVGVRYANGPILVPGDDPDVPDFDVLAVFTTELARNGTPKGVMVGAPAAVAGEFGKGRVVCFSPHPEQTQGLEGLVRRAIEWTAHDAADPDAE